MKTLAIETSCDDTSIALVSWEEGIFAVEYMKTADQLKTHNQYGGVVPQLAYQKHAENILPLIEEFLAKFGNKIIEEIDFITVTSQPGLPGSLRVGITSAYTLGALRNKQVAEVNHIMGHVFSILIDRSFDDIVLPYVCLTVSGGHNDLYLVQLKVESEKSQAKNKSGLWTKRQHIEVGSSVKVGPFVITKLGQTIDDAAGEVFDKVARMLGGPYPGGKRIGEMAEQGGLDERVEFRPSYLKKDEYNFSFSGLKSQVYYLLKQFENKGIELDDTLRANIARAFQEAITDVLVKKTMQCVEEYGAKTLGLVGGVSANKRLREKLEKAKVQKLQKNSDRNIQFILPSEFRYCMDNAGMIGVVGIMKEISKEKGER